MARRSSARLREKTSSTPKRASLSSDALVSATHVLPAKLTALHEADEMPGAFPTSQSPPSFLNAATVTPTKTTAISPAEQEMHPQRHHQTTAKPRDEARHLGFSTMIPQTEPSRKYTTFAALQTTPTRAKTKEADRTSPLFEFTFRREHSLQLSPAAKQLMREKRAEAASIREQMVAGRGNAQMTSDMPRRTIAMPSGRFGQAHMEQFRKMDSIEGHASAFRADPKRIKATAQVSMQIKTSSSTTHHTSKSLKRSLSKAEFDSAPLYSSPQAQAGALQLTPKSKVSQLSRATSNRDSRAVISSAPGLPVKRVKRAECDDTSTCRHIEDVNSKQEIATTMKQVPARTRAQDLRSYASPTTASAKRTVAMRTIETPDLLSTSCRPQMQADTASAPPTTLQEIPTPLLSRPPTKASLFRKTEAIYAEPSTAASPLPAHFPSKARVFKNNANTEINVAELPTSMAPFLARSPTKRLGISPDGQTTRSVSEAQVTPFLSRSPAKATGHKCAENSQTESEPKSSGLPLLAQSPSKFSLKSKAGVDLNDQTPAKDNLTGTASRFGLLRQSPIKSILRSPQRLYSDDPAKIAAGTHLATPPRPIVGSNRKGLILAASIAAQTPHTSKHVEFTSSTKAREKVPSSTPKSASASPTPGRVISTIDSPKDRIVGYPDLAQALSPSPQKHCLGSTPRDFTFRAGNPIVFGPSTQLGASGSHSTIRHVSPALVTTSTPIVGSKKRKLDFESRYPAGQSADKDAETYPDKENVSDTSEDVDRPAKRVKQSEPSPSTFRPAVRLATSAASPAKRGTPLGVKPRKVTGTTAAADAMKKAIKGKPSTISRDRLSALAQPKRRA